MGLGWVLGVHGETSLSFQKENLIVIVFTSPGQNWNFS
jgi:hypothetical protein